MSKMKLISILLLIATMAWCGSLVYAIAQISTQRYLKPGDRFIQAFQVEPTEDPKIWRFIKQDKTIEAEYQGELTEPLNSYVAKAIEIADKPKVVVVREEDWNTLPIKEGSGVYKFKDSYYLIGRGTATMYTDMVIELETVDLSKIGVAGIPLGIGWVSIGTYRFRKRGNQK
ncbi:MAG: hypothetical protein QXJ07_06170 [Candidatus Bathyarchaeia archaeon]